MDFLGAPAMEVARESIFISAVRTFCKVIGGILGILIGGLLILFVLMMFSSPDIYPPKSSLVISPDANGNRNLLAHNAPVLLKLDIKGIVGQGDLTTDKFQNSLFDSREGMLAGNRVKGILLHINTPGGVADDADAIYRELMAYKQKYQVPIYAYVDGLCASGGMYIASAADKIFATPSSVIGSIGVILGPTFNVSGLMDRYGVQSLTITQGLDKDMLNPFRPWQPGEDACLRSITAALYERFVGIVTGARTNLDREKLVNEYGAKVFIASTAQTLGYIDSGSSDYTIAIAELAKEAKISEGQSYQVMTIEPVHSFLSDLTQERLSLLSGKVTHHFQINAFMNSELSGRFLYLYNPL